MAWLVAGLGNPDDRYARTRHNLGRMVVDELARESGERFRKVRFLPVESAEIRVAQARVILSRSTRYMNESGPSYASLAKKQGVDPAHLIAVHDELDIPAGTIRVKQGGGHSGHNGLRSLDQALRTPDYLRVRGVELLNGPTNRPWGVRTASFADPDGHIWEVAGKIP